LSNPLYETVENFVSAAGIGPRNGRGGKKKAAPPKFTNIEVHHRDQQASD